jgi:hypothetical protein
MKRFLYSRTLSTTTTARSIPYIDVWFESIRKPPSFYETLSNEKIRKYFYNIDLQGRLFLEETSPKNIATSIKADKFLNDFFSRIRWAKPKEMEYIEGYNDYAKDYPFVSKCGVEINYIRPAATPIVFHSLVDGCLLYGGNLVQPFDSSKLAISERTGRLYHRLLGNDDDDVAHGQTRNNRVTTERLKLGYGLIRSSVAVSLSEYIHHENSGWKFRCDGSFSEIDWLPSTNEPGNWSMPEDGEGIL